MNWSLERNGSADTFANWGVVGGVIRRNATGFDTFTFTQPAKFFSSSFAWGDLIALFLDGVCQFRGILTGIRKSAASNNEETQYEVSGPWYYLRETMFVQTWAAYINGVKGTDSTSHVILNSGGNIFSLVPMRQQLDYIVQKAIDAGRPIAKGDMLSGYDLFAPLDEVRDLTSAECIEKELRWCPDAVAWWDYTVNPPKLNIQRRTTLTAQTLTIGQDISNIEVRSREDLQRPGVIIHYEIKTTVDGKEYFGFVRDAYPVNLTGTELSILYLTIDINGADVRNVKGDVVGDYLTILDPVATAEDKVNWIKRKIPGFGNTDIAQNIVIESVTRNPGSSGYAQELVEGQIAPWMHIGNTSIYGEEDYLIATITYDLVNPADGTITTVNSQPFSFKFIATNSPAGLTHYQSVESVVQSDPIPAGLAQFLYENLAVLQFDGTFQLTEQEISATGRPGNTINIMGGRLEWQAAKMMVQEKIENIDTGESIITVGPSRHLGAQDIIELLRVSRPRRRWTSLQTQIDASIGPSTSVELGKATANSYMTPLGGGGGGADFPGYLLKEVHDDYCTFHKMIPGDPPTQDNSKNYYIAKPPGLRKSGWDGQTIAGVTYSDYRLDSQNNKSGRRTATQGTVVETQEVTPLYVAEFSIIHEVLARKTGLLAVDDDNSEITLVDMNADGRSWAKIS